MNGEQKEAAYLKADDILKESSNYTDQAKNDGITEVAAGYVLLCSAIWHCLILLKLNSVLSVYAKMDSIL